MAQDTGFENFISSLKVGQHLCHASCEGDTCEIEILESDRVNMIDSKGDRFFIDSETYDGWTPCNRQVYVVFQEQIGVSRGNLAHAVRTAKEFASDNPHVRFMVLKVEHVFQGSVTVNEVEI